MRRVGALVFALTALGCGIAGMFVFDGKAHPVTLIVLGSSVAPPPSGSC